MMAVSEKQIGVRMPLDAYAKVKSAAKENKCGPSTFLRRLAYEALGIQETLVLPTPKNTDSSFPNPAQGAPGRRRRRSA